MVQAGSVKANGRLRFASVHVVSCCVYEITKHYRQSMKGNYLICLKIGQIPAFMSFY